MVARRGNAPRSAGCEPVALLLSYRANEGTRTRLCSGVSWLRTKRAAIAPCGRRMAAARGCETIAERVSSGTMSLREELESYAKQCAAVLATNGQVEQRRGSLKLVFNEDLHLRTGVQALEQHETFRRLIAAAQSRWAGEFHKLPGPTCGDSEWPMAVGNVLKRTGFYHAVLEGDVDTAETEGRLDDAFSRREVPVTYLAPLEFVSFKTAEFDFGNFAVKQFTRTELDALLEMRTCRAFYPHATYETGMLHQCHFVTVRTQAPSTQIGNPFHKSDFGITWSEVGKVPLKFSKFPQPLESALATLALFPWREDHWKYGGGGGDLEGAFTFEVPFVIRIDDDILDWPRAAHDVRNLADDPNSDGDRPLCLCYLDGDEETQFRQLVGATEKVIQLLGGWNSLPRYLANAMGFILKACFSDRRDGILWNTVSIEALLGRNQESLTKSVGRRLEWIGAISEAEFKKLYGERCALVHGSVDVAKERQAGGKAARARDTKEARDAATRTALWFMNLEAAKIRISAGVAVPTHDDMLDLLDFRPFTRDKFGEFIAAMPDGFPKIEHWVREVRL